jgi:hypothetical protein
MKNSKSSHLPKNKGIYLSTFEDGSGRMEFLMHTEEDGFYLLTIVQQVRKGRTWENFPTESFDQSTLLNLVAEGKVRDLQTFRRMTREQVARKIIEEELPEQEGLRESIISALFTPTEARKF